MGIEVIAGLLLKYGPDLAEKLVELYNKRTDPTAEEIKEVFALARKPFEAYLPANWQTLVKP